MRAAKTVGRLFLCALGLSLAGSRLAEAEFISAYTGHAEFGANGYHQDRVDAEVNYAVYRNTGNWITALGLTTSDVRFVSGPASSSGATLVLFYEVVNNAPYLGIQGISKLDLPVNAVDILSYGYLGDPTLVTGAGHVFNEADNSGNNSGAVTISNPALGSGATGYDLSNTTPFVSGTTGMLDPRSYGFLLDANFLEVSFFPQKLEPNQHTAVLFVTANATTADWSEGALHGADAMSADQLPISNGTPLPEPSTVVVLAGGLLMLAGAALVRRRRRSRPVWKEPCLPL